MSHYKFIPTELIPELLSTPFRVQTNWHVITGAPSSGKTTVINQLAAEGFQTVPESARLYIENAIAGGQTINQLREDIPAMQHGIHEKQVQIENELITTDFNFLDRGIVDCLAWHRVFGLDPNEFLPDCFYHRYASVFNLAPLPYIDDGARYENPSIVGFLDEWTNRDYQALGYKIIRVPVLPPEERLEFILDKVNSDI